MPCRNALPAASGVRHIFITDDVLAEAFHRFARISHANRRHGSNVPGPLEARRRLAKRKMGMQAVTSGNPPSSGDFGALFGLGAAPPPRKDFERGWRWEAPASLPLEKPIVGREMPWAGIGSDGLPLERQEDVAYEDERRVEEFLSAPPDPVETSKAAFETLLHPLENRTVLKEKDMEPILAFLNSSAADPDAQLILNLFEWMATRTMSLDSWKHIGRIIKTKSLAAEISTEELVSVFKLVLQRQDKNLVIPIIACRIPASTIEVFSRITEHIIHSAVDVDERRARVLDWLACLRSCVSSLRWRRADTDLWRSIYDVLAQHFQPSDLEEHFGVLLRDQFALVLLRHWVPRYVSAANSRIGQASSVIEDPTTIDRIEFKQIAFNSRTTQSVDWTSIEKLFRAKQREVQAEEGAQKSALIDLVSLLAHRNIPYAEVLTEIFAVYIQTQPASTTKNLFMDLRARKNCGIPTTVAAQLVHHFLDTGDFAFAFFVFRSVPTVPLLQCFDLPIKLIEAGRTHGAHIFGFLNRQTPEDIVPEEYRTNVRLTLKQEHIDLVHMAAYTFASSPHLRPRTAFRRVWECYRFLIDRRAPLTPLLSRAMVKAGISRPLKEEGKLAATQVRCAIGVIERIEGKSVAEEVDKLVYEFWVRSFHERVKMGAKWGPSGGEEQRYFEGRRKLWMKSGGRVFLPPVDEAAGAVEEGDEVGVESAAQLEVPDVGSTFPAETEVDQSREMAEVGTSSGFTAQTYLPFGQGEIQLDTCANGGAGDVDARDLALEAQAPGVPHLSPRESLQTRSFEQAVRSDAVALKVNGTMYQPFAPPAKPSSATEMESTPFESATAIAPLSDMEEPSKTVPEEDVDSFIDALDKMQFGAVEETEQNTAKEHMPPTPEVTKADDAELDILTAMHKYQTTHSESLLQGAAEQLNHILWKSLDLEESAFQPSSVRSYSTDIRLGNREQVLKTRKIWARPAWELLPLPSVGLKTVHLRGRDLRTVYARALGKISDANRVAEESERPAGTTIHSFRPTDSENLDDGGMGRTGHPMQRHLDLKPVRSLLSHRPFRPELTQDSIGVSEQEATALQNEKRTSSNWKTFKHPSEGGSMAHLKPPGLAPPPPHTLESTSEPIGDAEKPRGTLRHKRHSHRRQEERDKSPKNVARSVTPPVEDVLVLNPIDDMYADLGRSKQQIGTSKFEHWRPEHLKTEFREGQGTAWMAFEEHMQRRRRRYWR